MSSFWDLVEVSSTKNKRDMNFWKKKKTFSYCKFSQTYGENENLAGHVWTIILPKLMAQNYCIGVWIDREFTQLSILNCFIVIRVLVCRWQSKMSITVGKTHVHAALLLQYFIVKLFQGHFACQYSKVPSFANILRPSRGFQHKK